MYPNFGYFSKFRKWDTHFDLLEKKKEEKFIGLKIKEINKDIITVKIHQTSNKEIHNNVESIFSVIKRIFNRTKRSRSLQLSNKETKLKNTIYNIYRLI